MKQYWMMLCLIGSLFTAQAQITAIDWYNKGKTLNNELKHTEAKVAFEKAVNLNPKYAEAYAEIGWIYNEMQEYDKAIETFKKAIALKKDYALVLDEIGYAYKQKGSYSEAINYLNQAIAANKYYATPHKQLGDVYMKLDKPAEAIAAYEKAYSLDDKSEVACYELGYWYNGNKEYEKALLWLNRAIAVTPYASTYNEIGFANYKLLKNDEAIAAYKKALELEPLNGTAYKGIGDVYRRNYSPTKTSEAIENYKKAIEYNPKSSGSHFGLGWCYNDLKFYDLAIPSLNKAIELDNKLSAAYTELGYAHYMKGNNHQAISAFDKGIATGVEIDLPLYYRGLIYVDLKDKTNANKSLDQLKLVNTELSEKLKAEITAMQ